MPSLTKGTEGCSGLTVLSVSPVLTKVHGGRWGGSVTGPRTNDIVFDAFLPFLLTFYFSSISGTPKYWILERGCRQEAEEVVEWLKRRQVGGREEHLVE